MISSFTQRQQGFTIIEMMVSLALFAVVVTVSVGALLALVGSNEQLQNEQSVMTNLSFALDSMTREIRTGTAYYCVSFSSDSGVGEIFNDTFNLDTYDREDVNDCRERGTRRYQGITFIEGGDSVTGSDDRILYYYDATEKKIFRRVGAGAAQSIVSSGIVITDAEFIVSGSGSLSHPSDSDEEQASVSIFIEAREADSSTAKPYRIQTNVTQRTLDI